MNAVFHLLIAAAAAGLLAGIIILAEGRSLRKSDPGPRGRRSLRQRATLAREARRRLENNHRDHKALLTLADLSYEAQDYVEAFERYQTLAPLAGTNPEVDPRLVNLRLGHAALRLGNLAEAYRAFRTARSLNENDFESNYNLGLLEFQRRRYAPAAGYLTAARAQSPDHPAANRYLGVSLYLLKAYPEAVRALEKALDFEPGDRQAEYLLGRAYFALNQARPALRIFSRLRQDPGIGATACLFAGTIHAQARRFRQAAEDFQRGLRHPATPAAITLELKYRLAAVCREQGELARSVRLWREIADARVGYKDVERKLAESAASIKSRAR